MIRESKFNFNLTVEPNALVCPNPTEWYHKAYLVEEDKESYRLIPGVKNETKIATSIFDDLTQPANCGWIGTDVELNAKDIKVDTLAARVQICQFDVEDSFASLDMAKGVHNWQVNDFMAHFWNTFSLKLQDEIANMRWRGDKTLPSGFLKNTDGYEKKFAADPDVLKPVLAVPITEANVLTELKAGLSALPLAVKQKKEDLRIYMSPQVALEYKSKTAGANVINYLTKELDFTYLGIKIIEVPMADDAFVITRKDNMIYAFDGQNDSKDLKIVDMLNTTVEPYLRALTFYRVGFDYVNPEEIYYYSSITGS